MMDFITNPGGWINDIFQKILLLIDGCIYWAFSQLYQIFLKLADARIFSDEFFSNFASRIYAILGVIMLFYLAYALLNAIVDPDKLSKGDKSLAKIAQNIVVSLVILGLLPTLFDFAYKLQGVIFQENVIGAIVFGVGGSDDNNRTIKQYGNMMAYTAINPFLNPGNYNVNLSNNYSWFNLKKDLIENGNFLKLPRLSKWAVDPQPLISPATQGKDDSGNEIVLPVGTNVDLGYKPVISTLCGAVLCYILLTFCLDLGVRVVKFAFCQLIAPIPVIMKIMPEKKDVFNKWLKLTLGVYFEVFVRCGIMYMVIYFFAEIANGTQFSYVSSGVQGKLVLVIILMGLLTFAKQVPKLISEVLGLNTGNMKLGIRDKLKAGGFFAAGAAIGAGGTMLARNLTHGVGRAWNNARQGHLLRAAGNLVSTPFSMLGGTTSGLVHGVRDGLSAKNFTDMRKSATSATSTATTNREERERYSASHTIVGHHVPIVASMAGHVGDTAAAVGRWAEIGGNVESLKYSQKLMQSVVDSRKEVMDRAKFIRDNIEDGKRHVTFTYEDSTGTTQTVTNMELGYLRQHYEHLKANPRTSARDLRDMELLLKAADKQANQDIINGLKLDGSGARMDVADYDGELKAKINKLMTNTHAASGEMTRNVTVAANVTKLNDATTFVREHRRDDVATLTNGGVDVFDELVNPINAPSREATNNVNQRINRFYENENNNR